MISKGNTCSVLIGLQGNPPKKRRTQFYPNSNRYYSSHHNLFLVKVLLTTEGENWVTLLFPRPSDRLNTEMLRLLIGQVIRRYYEEFDQSLGLNPPSVCIDHLITPAICNVLAVIMTL